MKNELRIFFTALMFYTRIPCPKWVDHDAAYINKATRYFPLIGYIVGGISALIFILATYVLGSSIALWLSILAGILVTGAFHEDGLADVCDGFGGGWTKAKILDIMKDSRVGAYGAIGIVLLLGLKFLGLQQILELKIPNEYSIYKLMILIFITYHALARWTAITIVFTETYAREDLDSKAKPIAQACTYKEILGATLFGLAPLLLLSYVLSWYLLFILLPLFFLRFFMVRYFNKWIEGYTGDCLGAVEQIAEVVTVLGIIGVLRFSIE
jgi:adenosylcobinamide-GDP ribazoletransferase